MKPVMRVRVDQPGNVVDGVKHRSSPTGPCPIPRFIHGAPAGGRHRLVEARSTAREKVCAVANQWDI